MYINPCLPPEPKLQPLPEPAIPIKSIEPIPVSESIPESKPIHILILGRTLEEQNELDRSCDGLLNKLGILGSDISIFFLDHYKGKPEIIGKPEITGKIRKVPIKKVLLIILVHIHQKSMIIL